MFSLQSQVLPSLPPACRLLHLSFPAVKGSLFPCHSCTKLASSPSSCGPCSEGSGPAQRDLRRTANSFASAAPPLGSINSPKARNRLWSLLEKGRLPAQVKQDPWKYGDLPLAAVTPRDPRPPEENPPAGYNRLPALGRDGLSAGVPGTGWGQAGRERQEEQGPSVEIPGHREKER